MALPVIGWKLWYADGTTVNCDWVSAPKTGVQVLMLYHPEGRRTIVAGKDEYLPPGEQGVKLGTWMCREQFEQIQQEAVADSWRP